MPMQKEIRASSSNNNGKREPVAILKDIKSVIEELKKELAPTTTTR
jgi:hypothetical protein